ncbi:MAG: UDP-N-acetylmuramoyl-L-alanyl-D-glutamate--2,6-diaminopimelate ligase, partial [Eubacteriaceae bacterium]|nr:UDP-N-acetylmuramoyl-L-alanyl-D-glutamate--2,6-diaminopimelate ligase [Eubacteriaceae bacterium]
MKLDKLIKDLSIVKFKNYRNADIDNIAYSSLNCTQNSLFIAIDGYSEDGHKYIDNAILNGAIAVVHSKEIEYKNDIIYIKVANSRDALARIASNFYENPSEKLNVTAITGTNGKTTFCTMAKCVFENAGKKTALSTTVGLFLGDRVIPAKVTTPQSADLQYYLKSALDYGCEYFFMEASSQGLVQQRAKYTTFDACVFSNLTHDHLDFHGDMESYYQAKKILFSNKHNYSIINIDDQYGTRLSEELKQEARTKVITFSFNNTSDYKISGFTQKNWSQTFTLTGDNYTDTFALSTAGKHNAYNAVPVIIYALLKGIPSKTIKAALKKYIPADGRLNIIKYNNFDIIIDFAHTPDGLLNLLNTAKANTINRIITVFSCNGNRDKEKRPVMGKIAYDNSDVVIITQGSPRGEDDNAIFEDIK